MAFLKATSNQMTILFLILLVSGIMMAYTFREAFVSQPPSFPLDRFTPPEQVTKRKGVPLF
jgi:hypothetical protein